MTYDMDGFQQLHLASGQTNKHQIVFSNGRQTLGMWQDREARNDSIKSNLWYIKKPLDAFSHN